MDRPFPSYEGDDSYLFVSYAHDDTELTFPEMAWIKESGFNLWYDDGIHVGTVWRRALAEALNKSAGLIFFCTARSAESDNCLKEINFALDQGKTVFVVRLDDTPLPLELQLSLSDRQAMVRSDFDESTYRARLTSALASLVKPESQLGDGNSDSKKTTRTEWAMVVNPILASGTDEELHLIAEDLTDDLMTVIPKRFHGMTILTDQASDTALILSGTVRKRGAEVRTTMKLMSEFNHRQIWAETYDRPLQDFYQSQAQLINQICGSLQEPIIMAVQEYYKDIEDDELDAIGLLSRVFLKRFSVVNRETRDKLLYMVRRLVQVAPDVCSAQAVLAVVLHSIVVTNFTRHPEELAQEAVEHIDKALAISPNNTFALSTGALIHRCFGIELLALKLAERCTAILGFPDTQHFAALLQLGRVDEMIELARADEHASYENHIAALLKGNLNEALDYAQDYVGQEPQDFNSWVALANALALTGNMDEAQKVLDKIRQMVPTWTHELEEKGLRLSWRNDEQIVSVQCAGLNQLS